MRGRSVTKLDGRVRHKGIGCNGTYLSQSLMRSRLLFFSGVGSIACKSPFTEVFAMFMQSYVRSRREDAQRESCRFYRLHSSKLKRGFTPLTAQQLPGGLRIKDGDI